MQSIYAFRPHRRQQCFLNINWLVLLLLASLCGCTDQDESSSDGAKQDRPPNIVLILADDLGYADVSAYGSEVISTPSIDALAAGGVRLTEGYVSHPVCSPSRAGLLTGRYQQRHGWEFNPAGRDKLNGMDTRERTLADELRERGYATGMVGKWHLGQRPEHHPMNRGFDEYFGVLEGGSVYIDSEVPGVESVGNYPRKRPNKVLRGFDAVPVEEYLTDVFTQEALAFVDRHRDEPFFLYLSHTTPHTPLQATAPYLDRYRHIDDKATRVYAAMVASLDDSVGKIVDKLKAIGQYENTLIVFLSDNGCAGYIGNACSNAPLAGYKRYHQEGGIRVPFIMSWPGEIPSAMDFESPVISLDLMATFAAAAGKAIVSEDSVNLLPYLRGERNAVPHEYLFWRSGPTIAVRNQQWKLIRYNKTELRPADLNSTGRFDPPEGGWPPGSPHGQITLLYDLEADPGESSNIAEVHPEVVERLMRLHTAWADQLQETPILPAIRSTLTEVDAEWVQLIF